MKNPNKRTNSFFFYMIGSISLLFFIACNQTPTDYTESKDNLLLKDTSISNTCIARLNDQIIDYFLISKQTDFKKFKKYTVSFFYKCIMKSYPAMKDTISEKDVFSLAFKKVITGKDDLRKNLKKLKTKMRYEIKEPIRVLVLDTTLFVNIDLNSYYIFKKKRRQIIVYLKTMERIGSF
jgi:hypothetical protein